MMVPAGKLNRRIELQASAPSVQPNGERLPVWKKFACAWAHIEPLSGSELERAKSFGANVTTRITIRSRRDVNEHHRAVYRGHVYLINAVTNPNETHDDTILYATEFKN